MPLDERLRLAHELAAAARARILPHYRTGLAVDDKADASPVTLADRGAEEAMRALIEAARPGDGIIGEEYGRVRADAEWVWVLDPVDGTKAFISGRPTFVTLIGLLHRGTPVLGVIDQAVTGERWVGVAGRPTTLNDAPVRVAPAPSLSRARLGTTGIQYFRPEGRAPFERLMAATHFTVFGGDGYMYGQLAFGGLHVIVEQSLKLHDYAALRPVVEGAGGVITDLAGRPLDVDSGSEVLAAASAELHAAALAVWRAGSGGH